MDTPYGYTSTVKGARRVKAFYVQEFGSGQIHDNQEDPVPGTGEVIVSVQAAGVGYMDVMIADGQYPLVTEPGFVLGSELAGPIVSVGAGVPPEVVGRRVFAMTTTRSFAQLCAVDYSSALPIPDGLGSIEAVALGINALVAQEILERVGADGTSEVLVRGASGGIGLMATQLAALRGARVTAVTSTEDRGKQLLELGADRYVSREAARTRGKRYDVIVDTVGGPDMPAFIEQLADNGRFVLCGGVAGAPPTDFGSTLMANFHRSPSFLAFSLNSVNLQTLRHSAQAVMGLAVDGSLRPVVFAKLALDDAAEALGLLRTGVFGKVIIEP
ncbi:zinc-binding dehydrogenase [Rhodococcus ruber]|uniref:Zinc-binding dehydrogenase n=1 Tax=Rhodococcus ruber TaxID=1830 RepID=A0ABT4MEV6_9NOCA|nr:zinc-binding dehydrogenase [Rhodococcus ruber]MCZ4519363.1 zinc-binding dehydrogenase [Rhodococcus ruber]